MVSPTITLAFQDQVMQRYANQLASLGDAGAQRALARALNYEGRKATTAVKRALRKQTSIPYALINRGIRTRQASPKVGGALEFAIVGTGRPFSLKVFKPKQFRAGVKATVWGRRQLFPGTFMGPRPGVIAPALGGHAYHRTSPSRLPIEKSWGPSIPVEMVIGETKAAFEKSAGAVLDRVSKEIAAVMRGF